VLATAVLAKPGEAPDRFNDALRSTLASISTASKP